jgi:hypothetical protein
MSHVLSDDEIAVWLATHPTFFEHHPELLAKLHIRHEHPGRTVSLIERQVMQLRRHNDELSERLTELMQTASDNDALFAQLSRVLLRLVSSASIAQMGTRLFNELREPFRCQQIAMLLLQDSAPTPWRASSASAFDKRLPGLLANRRALAGKWRRDELRFLFGETGLQLSSAAIIPLCASEQVIGVLSLGSTEASHFRSSMDTLFISHLGDVVGELLGGFLRHPSSPDLT